jgi:hypothetical protein
MNSMPKHDPQAIVATFDWQNWQRGASDEIAAPQFGQLRVCACILSARIPACGSRASLPALDFIIRTPGLSIKKSAGRIDNGCAMLSLHFRQQPFLFYNDFAFSRKHFLRSARSVNNASHRLET